MIASNNLLLNTHKNIDYINAHNQTQSVLGTIDGLPEREIIADSIGKINLYYQMTNSS